MNNSQNPIGEALFKYRDYTPIPLIILLFYFADSTVRTAALGITLVVAGELFRIYSVAFIGSISRTRKGNLGARLIKEGPFSFMRNPLYVGNFLITLGVSVFGGHLGVIALAVVLFSVQYYYIVKYEEELLRKTFGEEFDEFCREVPPWLPTKKLELDKIEWPDNFSPAIKSEKKTLMTIFSVIGILSLLA